MEIYPQEKEDRKENFETLEKGSICTFKISLMNKDCIEIPDIELVEDIMVKKEEGEILKVIPYDDRLYQEGLEMLYELEKGVYLKKTYTEALSWASFHGVNLLNYSGPEDFILKHLNVLEKRYVKKILCKHSEEINHNLTNENSFQIDDIEGLEICFQE